MYLPNIIKLSQTVLELWPAQDFDFRGDKYITKIVRVVSLAPYMPTGPPLLDLIYVPTKYYQIISTVLELWPAQDFDFRGDKYITKIVRVVSLAPYMPTYPPLYPYQI